MLTWIRSWLQEKSQKQAQEELDSARVQAIERAPIDQNSSKLFLTLYLSISNTRLDPNLED
jgi:hypothetical protein